MAPLEMALRASPAFLAILGAGAPQGLMAQKATLASKGMRAKPVTLERITMTFHPEESKGQKATVAQKVPRVPQDTWDHLGQMNVRFWTSS